MIDSSVFVSLERRGLRHSTLADVAPDESSVLASITAAELLFGVHRAATQARRLRREAFVEAILREYPVVPMDISVARVYAMTWSELASAGRIIAAHDLLIAATALSLGYSVLTENRRDFERVPGLLVSTPAW